MRKYFVLFAAGLLTLLVAAPTAAAPDLDKNKGLSEIVIDCTDSAPVDLGVFTVKAKSTPGWLLDENSIVNTPIQYRASMIEFFAGGVSQWTYDNAPPPGLEAKLIGPCTFAVEWEWDGVQYRVEHTDAYFTLPRPWE
jgi:hypothetical protein